MKLLKCRDKFHSFGKWFNPFATIIQILAIISASYFAIVQLKSNNHQSLIGNTFTFLENIQTKEFTSGYFETITWLENQVLNKELY